MIKIQLWLQYGVDHTFLFERPHGRLIPTRHRFHLHRPHRVYLAKLMVYLRRVSFPFGVSTRLRRGWVDLSWSSVNYRHLRRGRAYLTHRWGVKFFTTHCHRLLKKKPLLDLQTLNFTQESVLLCPSRWDLLLSSAHA